MKQVSLIIPARNEAAYLPRLLDSVEVARERYRHGAEAVEVVLVDNVSTDATAEVGAGRGCRVARVEKRIIGAVRNGGARAARGDILAFVDADFRIHPETFNAIDDVLESGRAVGGATGATLERMSPGIGLVYLLFLPMVWLTGMDTGVVFCRREDFEAVGGYREDLPVAEDVRFLLDLKRRGRPTRRKLVRTTGAKAIASTRKFDRHGEWHYLKMIPRMFFWFIFSRSSFDAFTRSYWYDDRG